MENHHRIIENHHRITEKPPSYNRKPPSYNGKPPSYNRKPPSYNRKPPSYNRKPPSYNRKPPSYNRKPPSKRKNMPVIGGRINQTSQHSSQVATVSNDTVVEINMVDHDYEEIDETNTVNASQNIDNTLHESEADSNSGFSISPTEDNEGYLHPYHSLVHSEIKGNFVLDKHHNATNLPSNVLLQTPYDPLQKHNKTPTISGFESMDTMDSQEPENGNNFDSTCSLEDKNIPIYAEVERKNQPAQNQIDRLL
ncbi:unnamed protein product [Mytilus coruscus]|uniref:Uncharacterized protein n=1 Tax=Mytilus coruscus TaxID=42192 RepID=A0A6J8BVL3_MYTCO|nr:unnamed protein product [Mytilus coruscus]